MSAAWTAGFGRRYLGGGWFSHHQIRRLCYMWPSAVFSHPHCCQWPPGAGKTTLAHGIASAVGRPAICRDEIKEGMAHATAGFVAEPGEELTTRTLSTFFGVLRQLLTGGVTTVAEAACQDRLWRPGLEPLRELAEIRIVQCVLDPDRAVERTRRRRQHNPVREGTPILARDRCSSTTIRSIAVFSTPMD